MPVVFSHRLRLSIAHLLLAAVLASPAVDATARQLSQGDKTNAKEAFYFVERDNWREALLHARRASNPLVSEYMTWRVLRNSDSEFGFSAYSKFLRENPDWPDRNRLVIRAENALFREGGGSVAKADLQRWFGQFPPISGKGKVIQAQVLGSSSDATALLRDAWINGDYDTTQEQWFLQHYNSSLRQQDHVARIDRLLWEGKTAAAKRLIPSLPAGTQRLFEARLILAENGNGSEAAIARVPSELRNDSGLQYERMKWRERKGTDAGVREILMQVKDGGNADKWWSSRHRQARKLLDEGQHSNALKLLDKHAQTNPANLADALFLQGWINLTKLKQPAKALPYFEQLDKTVNFPVSKSRAAYWIARTHAALGQNEKARQWYTNGASHPTTFYGQLSHAKLNNAAPFSIPTYLAPSAQEKQKFENDRRVQVVHMLASAGRHRDALTFINHLANEPISHGRAALVADLGNAIGRRDFALIAAKESLKQGVILPQQSYPFFSIPFTPKGEQAMIWAITRQESLFDPQAESSAGAKGLMQLLPSTAKEVARKNDLPYNPATLSDPTANIRLGDVYINERIRQFDGSYILAIASYNAGQGRVRQWQGTYGDIGKTPEQAIDWIEGIPFSETRNYVQRVLENLQVYRVLLPKGQGNAAPLLEKDLVR